MKKLLAVGLLAASAGLLAAPPSASAESLWSGDNGYSGYNIFADRKARNVGDILTIVISESTTTSTSKSSSNEKDASVSMNVGTGVFEFLEGLFPATTGASHSDSFEASGSKSDTNRIAANVTVTVTEVLPNGQMVLEGTQSIWQNKDEHKITFRGICRPEDVTVNNTIPSNRIADATVRFDGKGPLNAKQRQGILTQVLNFLF